MEIKQSSNYNDFLTILGNRPIVRKKIFNLKTEVENGLNLFPYCPIVVYEDKKHFKIIDGQHRFIASKELKLPIYYVVCEELNLIQIAKLNSNSSNWSNRNFLDCFIKTGNKDYEILRDFIKKYKVSYSTASDLLMLGHIKYKGSTLNKFREGLFKVNHYDFAVELISEVEDIFGRYEFWNHGILIEAYRLLRKAGKFDKQTLIMKIKSNPNMLDKRLSVKEYLFNIERVYNDRLQNRVSIF